MVSEVVKKTPFSPMLIPFVKNCMDVVVFLTPLEPVISTVLPTGIPPFSSVSSFTMRLCIHYFSPASIKSIIVYI
jgi:hypothetical protein